MAYPAAARLRSIHPPNSHAPLSLPLALANSLPHAVWLVIAATLAHALPGANAYSWNFGSTPQQCTNLTINVTGNDGVAPYRVLIIPFGPSPLPNNVEARRITEQVFARGGDKSGSFQLNYPANSQFVAVVSDATGFGSGGTSVSAQVGTSSNSSCFDPTKNVSPDFVFSIEPANQVVQCQPMRIWWDPTQVQGTPNFQGVIPGGQSFAIPRGQITQVESQGTGFTWIPNVRGGTTLMLVGGDDRGNGTAGSVLFVVSSGINNNSTCLDQNSPSSTPGSPAGGSYPTSTSGAGGGSGGGGSSTGAIVGGVVGGVAFLSCLILALFFFRRRSNQKRRVKERPVDLLHEDEDEDEDDDPRRNPNAQQSHQLEYYTPEPFMVTDPTAPSDGATTAATGTGYGASSSDRPLSGTSFTRSETTDFLGVGYGWAAGSTTTSNSRKGAPPRMRPVNIVQHEDAGPPPPPADKEEETETIELPPAYTAVQNVARTTAAPGTTQPRTGGPDTRPPDATAGGNS
ncbi:hypothetical protein P691DRAFT_802020 [Macrolepiota fuliginosa MF-IS2]|uniref:Uncharacterized protein n=1 Tax=Macrolepiota fuliginosa MF-IS2 TaxID=1400762 RepID=A0A9P6C8Q1_9AGAR|nr:hypothetical protein P691DRAFT_802020 [Macrolepiota fuliginosa MF-IS2]